jgi:hypothetical protein
MPVSLAVIRPRRTVSLCRRALLVAALTASCAAAAQSVRTSTDLTFGSFIVAGPGAVAVNPYGQRTATGRVFLKSSGEAATPAQVQIKGTANAMFFLTTPDKNQVSLSNETGSRLSLGSFVCAPRCSGIFSPKGTAMVSLGASLVVGPQQDSGAYSGHFFVTVNYE